MPVFIEKNLEFDFDNSWAVQKYDEEGSYYKTLLDKNLKGSKAVDFICIHENIPLILMEVKDYSQGVPFRQKFDTIPETIALKVRDTLAGIIGGSFRADNAEQTFYKESIRKLISAPRVIYFFEDLCTPARRPPQRILLKRNVLLKKLKQHLRWLTTEIIVIGLADYHDGIERLAVRRNVHF